MRWFAVRTVYAHENSDGPPWYLDRHILIHADDDGDDLLERIEVVSARYLELNPNASVIGDHAAPSHSQVSPSAAPVQPPNSTTRSRASS